MRRSVADQLGAIQAKVLMKLQDVNMSVLGTKSQILRIDKGEIDDMGGYEEELRASIIENTIITHPFGAAVQIFSDYDKDTMQLNTTAMDLYEFLPITLKIPYFGNPEEKPTSLYKGDIIVEIIQDEYGNKIPLVMAITKIIANISNKYIVGKHYEMALYRGELPPMIKDYITRYIAGELG